MLTIVDFVEAAYDLAEALEDMALISSERLDYLENSVFGSAETLNDFEAVRGLFVIAKENRGSLSENAEMIYSSYYKEVEALSRLHAAYLTTVLSEDLGEFTDVIVTICDVQGADELDDSLDSLIDSVEESFNSGEPVSLKALEEHLVLLRRLSVGSSVKKWETLEYFKEIRDSSPSLASFFRGLPGEPSARASLKAAIAMFDDRVQELWAQALVADRLTPDGLILGDPN